MAYQNTVQAYGPGVGISTIPSPFFTDVDPESYNINFPVGQTWINQTLFRTWQLMSFISTSGAILANWQLIANGLGGDIESITTPDATVVVPTSSNVNFLNGTGISITGSGSNVTFNASGGAYTWNLVTTTSQALAASNVYVSDSASLITFSLPTTAAFGATFGIVGYGAGGWTISQSTGQSIHMGALTTMTGTGGSLSSTIASNVVFISCIVANTTFKVINSMGNITVT